MPKKNLWWEDKEMSAEEREELLSKIEETAKYNEANYGGCCQSVLSAVQQYLNLGDGEAFKAASALAGGFANCGEICGSLTGGMMAIGLACGREKFEDVKLVDEWREGMAYPPITEGLIRGGRLVDRFLEKFGSLRCRDIRHIIRGRPLAEDFRRPTKEYKIEYRKDHYKCGEVTGPAARIAAEIILEPRESFADEIHAFLAGR